MKEFIVTRKATKPEGGLNCCWCKEKVGKPHKETCPCIRKKIKLRVTIEYKTDTDASFNREEIEFLRNEGTWCASNALDEIHKSLAGECLCGKAKFEYLGDTSEPYLDE